MDNFINDSLVDYDLYASKVSEIINRLFYTEYLLTSLAARAEVSCYEGFANFFIKEKNDVSFQKECLIDEFIRKEKPINFEKINGIELRGNKISDLIKIYKECLLKNIMICNEISNFIAKDVSAKMTFSLSVVMVEDLCNTSLVAVNKISKMLDKALNNYAALLTIDKILCDKYKKDFLK